LGVYKAANKKKKHEEVGGKAQNSQPKVCSILKGLVIFFAPQLKNVMVLL
jgi:hypothetical protein